MIVFGEFFLSKAIGKRFCYSRQFLVTQLLRGYQKFELNILDIVNDSDKSLTS
jgi:hypothetical protein